MRLIIGMMMSFLVFFFACGVTRSKTSSSSSSLRVVWTVILTRAKTRWFSLFFFFFATGPFETPYQGGTFLVDIHITNAYPFEPPKMKFLTKVWHPNVSSQSGAICLDVLKDQWTPALTIKTALLSVQALLAAAEPDDPQDAVVAKMYVANRAQFDAQAKEWTEKYAKEGQKIEQAKDPKVVKLMEMGFGEQDAERALAKCNFNQEEALEYLLSQ